MAGSVPVPTVAMGSLLFSDLADSPLFRRSVAVGRAGGRAAGGRRAGGWRLSAWASLRCISSLPVIALVPSVIALVPRMPTALLHVQ